MDTSADQVHSQVRGGPDFDVKETRNCWFQTGGERDPILGLQQEREEPNRYWVNQGAQPALFRDRGEIVAGLYEEGSDVCSILEVTR